MEMISGSILYNSDDFMFYQPSDNSSYFVFFINQLHRYISKTGNVIFPCEYLWDSIQADIQYCIDAV